jgi:MinD-like ATPase involved in chromosome partitioning or flagellar assembly
MPRIISVHSFRGGTGKSNTCANLAALLAMQGKHVAVIDTDIQSPGVHVLFGLAEDAMEYVLNDYLWGRCEIEKAVYDVSARLGKSIQEGGRISFIPSSINPSDIARVLHDGYDVNLLSEGFHRLIDTLRLDHLIIDTHPGLNEETLLSIAISNALVVVLRPDKQDYLGTAVTVDVARELDVPDMLLLVNKVPASFDPHATRELVEQTYGCRVGAVLPHSDELMSLASDGLFVALYPEHFVSQELDRLAQELAAT